MSDFRAELEQVITGNDRVEQVDPRVSTLTGVASGIFAHFLNEADGIERAYRPLIADVIRDDIGIGARVLERVGANPPVMLTSSIKHEHHERPKYDKKLSPIRRLFNRFEQRVYPTITKVKERYWRLGRSVMHVDFNASLPHNVSSSEMFASKKGDIVVADVGTRIMVFDYETARTANQFEPVRAATDLDIVPHGSVDVFQPYEDFIVSPEKQPIVQQYRSRMIQLLEASLQEQD